MKKFLNPSQHANKFSFGYVVCMALILVGCGSGGASIPPVALSSIAISPDPVFIGASTTLSLTATGTYSDGTTANLTTQVVWKSADPLTASVASTGVITAHATSGAKATITAALNGVSSPAVTVTVTTASSIASTDLITARYDHTATLLLDGSVLVGGGYNSTALASAELYDPISKTWTTAGNMGVARRDHTAILLLPSGQVLLIGGGAGPGLNDLDSAEMYTPSAGTPGTGTWTSYRGILQTPRSYHTATLLNTNKVLVVGGGVNNSADLYDPNTPAASAVPAAADISSTGRYSHTATLLQDNSVLVVGGFDGTTALATAELYVSTGSTVAATDSLATARYLHTATLLNDGRVLVVGGIDSTGHEVASAELYYPAAATGMKWTATGSLATARFGHIATLMPNGQVLVMGGRNATNPNLSGAELYDPNTGKWSGTANLQKGRAVFTATLLNTGPNAGSVLVVGGDGAAGTLSSVELHN